MSAKAQSANEQTEDVEIAYGDTFRNRLTGEKVVVADARDGCEKIALNSGGFEYRSELVRAVNDESAIYEVEQRHDSWEDTPY